MHTEHVVAHPAESQRERAVASGGKRAADRRVVRERHVARKESLFRCERRLQISDADASRRRGCEIIGAHVVRLRYGSDVEDDIQRARRRGHVRLRALTADDDARAFHRARLQRVGCLLERLRRCDDGRHSAADGVRGAIIGMDDQAVFHRLAQR